MAYRQSILYGLFVTISGLPLTSIHAQTETQDSLSVAPVPVTEERTPLHLLASGVRSAYQISKRELTKVGRKLNDIDTTYISPNQYNLAFMLEQSTWFEHYRLGSNGNDGSQSLNFAPTANTKIGIYFGWRWIFLGLSFDIKKLLGKAKDQAPRKEIVFNLYSSRFGVDLYYRKTGSNFKLSSYTNIITQNNYEGIKFNGLQSNIKGLNAYWIFNYKRFSYPAAYSQSTNQRKSCGSVLAGFSYSQHNISFDHTLLPPEIQEQLRPSLTFEKVTYNDYNLSVGYGYNWVFARNCLLNLSLLPAIAYKKARIDDALPNNQNNWLGWVKDINFDLITRAGLTWNNGKYYVGASLVLHTYDYRKDNFSMTNSFGSLRVYAGFNFWKKKEYRYQQSK